MACDVLSDEFYHMMKVRVKDRLGANRFAHAESVAHTAILLAEEYDLDWRRARLAGILHDWDKNIDDESISRRARELGINTLPYVMETMPRLLHGLTAAEVIGQEYPEIPTDILSAIAHHTSARIGMSDLDMVVYIADVIEPLRPYPVTEKLRDLIGKISLEELFLRTLKQVFSNLVERNYRIHPATIEVWNHYIVRARERSQKQRKETRDRRVEL